MIKYTAGAMTIPLSESLTYEGEHVELSSFSLSAVYGKHQCRAMMLLGSIYPMK